MSYLSLQLHVQGHGLLQDAGMPTLQTSLAWDAVPIGGWLQMVSTVFAAAQMQHMLPGLLYAWVVRVGSMP